MTSPTVAPAKDDDAADTNIASPKPTVETPDDAGELNNGNDETEAASNDVAVASSKANDDAAVAPNDIKDQAERASNHVKSDMVKPSSNADDVRAGASNGDVTDNASKSKVPPPSSDTAGNLSIDPASFPRTPEGLAEFLSAVDGEDKDTAQKTPATYQANAVTIQAGSSKEIPIPIFSKGKVEWEVMVQESDVSLSILLQEPNDNAINICTEYIVENVAPASGEFHVTSVPSTIVLVFDNSYSWITPKTVAYKLKVSPPIDKARIQRTTKALEAVKAEMKKAEDKVATYVKDRERAHGEFEKYAKELREKEKNAASEKQKYEMVQKESKQAETEAKQAQKAVGEMETKLKEEERQLDELEKRIKELELERQVRLEERIALKGEIEKHNAQAAEKKAEAEEKKAKGEAHLDQVKKHEKHLLEKSDKVQKTRKARDEAALKEKKVLPELEHFKRQVEALESRLKGHS